MTNKPAWSLVNAMKYGVVFGMVFALLRLTVFTGSLPPLSTETLARLFGGALGGAILFGIVATVRNMLTPGAR